MINFRYIFNPSYSILGVILILIIIVLIFTINKNNNDSLRIIGKTILISGIISLIIDGLIYLITNNIIPSKYKIFVEVISNNLFKNIIYMSIISITLGTIAIAISKEKIIEGSE